jgi:uncharacterized protein
MQGSIGLLGGGGSILTVPLLVYGFGIETKAAMATSLLVVGVTSILTTIPYARRGQVCRRVGLLFGFAAMIGAYAGGWGARFIPAQALLSLFTAIMLATALAMLRSRPEGGGIAPPYASPCQKASTLPVARILVDGLLVGGATGLVGAGGGFLVVPALHLLGHLPMHAAIGTSVLVIAMKSFAGFAAYVQHVEVSYPLAGMLILVASIGTLLGSLVANRVQSARLKQGFGIFVLSVAGYFSVSRVAFSMAHRQRPRAPGALAHRSCSCGHCPGHRASPEGVVAPNPDATRLKTTRELRGGESHD